MANEIEAEVREYVKNEIEHGHVPTFKEVYSKYGNKEDVEDVYENMDLRTAWLSALAEHASDEVVWEADILAMWAGKLREVVLQLLKHDRPELMWYLEHITRLLQGIDSGRDIEIAKKILQEGA